MLNTDLNCSCARISNTGAYNTLSCLSNVCFDYVMYSVSTELLYKNNSKIFNEFLDLLNIKDLSYDSVRKNRLYTDKNMTIRKYTNSLVIIIDDSIDSMGNYLTRFELKGQGCRYFEESHKDNFLNKYIELFNLVNKCGGRFNRIDIAIDDFNYFNKKELETLLNNNHYSCKSRNFKNNSIKDNNNYISWGYSLGSDNSNFKLVIYDKILERNYRNYSVNLDLKQWLRFEYRFYSLNADKLILGILTKNNTSLINYLLSYCLSYFVFKKENKKDLNKSRWLILPKMKKLFNNVESTDKIKNQSNLESTLIVKKEWLKNTLRINEFVNLTLNDVELELKKLESEKLGLLKLKNVDINLINITRKKKNMPIINMKEIENNIFDLSYKINLIKKENNII